MELSIESQHPLDDAQLKLTAQQILKIKLKHEAHNKRKTGWTYYSHSHALFVLKVVLAAVKAPTKRVTLDTMRVDRKPETVYQRFTQGLKWLQEASDGELIGVMDESGMIDDDYKLACDAVKDIAITKQGVQIVITYSPPDTRRASSDDEILAMLKAAEPIADSADPAATENTFRASFTEFLESGPEDEQAEWLNVTDEDAKWAQMLAAQDSSITTQYTRKNLSFVCVKLSQQTLDALK